GANPNFPLEATASLLLGWPDEPSTWDFVESFGAEVAALYWKRKPSPHIEDLAAAEAAARLYVDVGRARDALRLVAEHAETASIETAMTVLEGVLAELNSGATRPETMLSYYVAQVLDGVERRFDDLSRIGSLEYAFIELLEGHRDPKLLHHWLAKEPSF